MTTPIDIASPNVNSNVGPIAEFGDTVLHLDLDTTDDLRAFEQLEGVWRLLDRVAHASPWWIADALILGEERFPDGSRFDPTQAIPSRFTPGSLTTYAWVSRKFPPSRRRAGLTFSHHQAVAGLDQEEQDGWLDKATAKRWSASELRRRVKASREAQALLEPSSQLGAVRSVRAVRSTCSDDRLAYAIRQITKEGCRFDADDAKAKFRYPDAVWVIPALIIDALIREHREDG